MRTATVRGADLVRRCAPVLAAVISGAALGLAFPKPDLHPLVWFALVPFFLVLRNATAWEGWWLGLVVGLVYRGIALYWLVETMATYGRLGWPLALAATAALVLVLASFIGIVGALAAWLPTSHPGGAMTVAAAWVALEYSQSFPLGGFPWAQVGYAAGRWPVFLQAADLAGIYGLGFVAVFVNVALAELISRRRERGTLAPITAAAIMLVALGAYGGIRLAWAPPPDPPGDDGLRVATIQGNVPQGVKWEPGARAEILARHLALSERAAQQGARLLVWSESSVPNPYGLARDPRTRAAIAATARGQEAWMLVGSAHLEPSQDGYAATNSAFLVGPDGEWQQRYDKVKLVPFGEYVPLRRWLPWIAPLVDAVGEFHAGDPGQPLLGEESGSLPPFAVAICYEIVFPAYVRRQVARGASFLVTITNDAWYGATSGPYQHFAQARVRAVENRRYLVRAANTGISGVIDPWGRVLASIDLNQTGVEVVTIHPRAGISPYAFWGDVFVLACVLLVGMSVYLRWRQED